MKKIAMLAVLLAVSFVAKAQNFYIENDELVWQMVYNEDTPINDIYKKMINENVDTDVVINGYHFIGVSYDDNGKTFKGKTAWLREKLQNATNEDPTEPREPTR